MDAAKTSYPKEKIKVLLLENISEIAVKNFQKQGYAQVQKLSKALSETELIHAVKDVHILAFVPKHKSHRRYLVQQQSFRPLGVFALASIRLI